MTDDDVLAELTGLADGLRERSPEALTRCHDLTADLLASVALGLLGDRRRAEDAVQETFLRLVRTGPKLRATDGREIRAWLVATTRNVCRDELRSQRRLREEPRDALPDESAETDDPAARVDQLDPELQAALDQLPEAQRTAVVLRHVAGLDGRELAKALGRSRGAAYALVERAERALRAHFLAESNPGPGARPSEGGANP